MMMGLFGIGCGGGGGGGGGGCHRTMASSTSVGGIPGRATRDVNWRSHLGEGMKALSTKLAEAAAATTAAAATAVDAAAESVGIASPVTSHGRKKVECAQVAAAIEASKKSKEDLDLQKAVNASLEAMSTLTNDYNNKTKNKNNPPIKPVANSTAGGESKEAEKPAEKPRARFVKDVAPRKTALAPGQKFTHSWRLCNNGRVPWGAVTAKCTGGDPLLGCDAVVPVESGVAPGQFVDINVALVTPDHEGRFISYWRLHDEASGVKFGDRIWVDVSVHEDDEQEQACKPEEAVSPSANDLKQEDDSLLDEAADVSLEDENPFAGAVAAAPLLEDLNRETNIEPADCASTATSSEAGSEAVANATSEEPDWVEVGNSLLAMSQAGNAEDTSESEPTEGGSEDAKEVGEVDATPSAPAVSPMPTSAPAEASSIEDVDPLAPLLEQLAAMGFTEADGTAALTASGGDIASAIAMLIARQ